jgi:hypothetical protein
MQYDGRPGHFVVLLPDSDRIDASAHDTMRTKHSRGASCFSGISSRSQCLHPSLQCLAAKHPCPSMLSSPRWPRNRTGAECGCNTKCCNAQHAELATLLTIPARDILCSRESRSAVGVPRIWRLAVVDAIGTSGLGGRHRSLIVTAGICGCLSGCCCRRFLLTNGRVGFVANEGTNTGVHVAWCVLVWAVDLIAGRQPQELTLSPDLQVQSGFCPCILEP